MWIPALVVLVVVVAVEDDPGSSIGWSAPTNDDVRAGCLALIGGLALFQVLAVVVARLGKGSVNDRVLDGARSWTPAAAALAALTAGITEEIVFRGFLLERLGEALGSYALAGVLTCVVFVAGHLPRWGIAAVGVAGPAVAFTWLYVATRNLPVCIGAHIANDLWAFVVGPWAYRRWSSGPHRMHEREHRRAG